MPLLSTHSYKQLIAVQAACQQDVHQFLINGVLGTVDLVDEYYDRLYRSAADGVYFLSRSKPVLAKSVFVPQKRVAYRRGIMRLSVKPPFFVLDAFHSIIRQEAKTDLTGFILVILLS